MIVESMTSLSLLTCIHCIEMPSKQLRNNIFEIMITHDFYFVAFSLLLPAVALSLQKKRKRKRKPDLNPRSSSSSNFALMLCLLSQDIEVVYRAEWCCDDDRNHRNDTFSYSFLSFGRADFVFSVLSRSGIECNLTKCKL